MKIKTMLALALILTIVTSAYGKNSLDRETVLHAEVPYYPSLAVEGRLSGTVQLHIVVEDGAVAKVEPHSPSQLQILINAATENVKTWRFAPGVRGEFDVSYRFELREDGAVFNGNPHIEMDLPTRVNLVATPVKPTCQDCGLGSFEGKPNKH
jgi:hypothetical protein